VGLHDALATCRELPWRRAMPAVTAGGGPAATCPRPSSPAADRRTPRPRVGLRLAALTAAAAAAALTLAIASPADAEEVFTSQAAAAHATDSTWIPAPSQRAAVCIVDTGNDPNPDTSNVIARLSVDGEPGTDRSPTHHGTLMSMIAAAPYNGFGMVGAAPSINLVSVRASRDGMTFGGTDLAAGMQQCLAYRNTYNIKVISLSLGGAVVSGLDAALMILTEDMVKNARRAGIDVVAAAGNHTGAVDWPAAYAPVMAIGAAALDGGRCAFAASGPEVDLWSAGCPVEAAFPDGAAAWASGSSEAAAFVAGVLTQLRQLRPDLTVDDAEQALTGNAQALEAGPGLDVGAAFAASRLVDQLVTGRGVAPHVAPSSELLVARPTPSSGGATGPESPLPTGSSTATPTLMPRSETGSPRQLPKPSVGAVRLRQQVLSLSFKNRPKGIEAEVRIYARTKRRTFPMLVRKARVVHDRYRTQVSGAVSQVSITYRDPERIRYPSALLTIRPAK
jgi:hypothetical protein